MWQAQPHKMKNTLAIHDRILHHTIEANRGWVFKTVGDAFCAAFDTAMDGLMAALDAQRELAKEDWDPDTPVRVRMSVHTGEAEERDRDYYGPALNRTARLESIGYGGQTLVSLVVAELVRDTLPDDVSLKEMGAHRLKDLTRPEMVFQVMHPDLKTEFPPLKSLDQLPHNLPVQPTPLIGREKEIRHISDMLATGENRTVTLTGPGGMGKTRLALQISADLLEKFEDGAFFVDLAPLRNPDLLPSTIAQIFRLQETGNRTILEVLIDFLKDRYMLLMLDNFEQIMAASGHVVRILSSCAGIRILVTSREPLHIRGEAVFQVPPLSVPDKGDSKSPNLEKITQYEAVRLFINRAIAAKQDFHVTNKTAPMIAEICQKLDGIPLAIELAAARIKLLSPQAILDRLEHRLRLLSGGIHDLPARQQTLRATMDWSYDLLDDQCKELFIMLSVFSGGFTLEAVEAVCVHNNPAVDVMIGLESLVDKSLVFPEDRENGEPRFHLLETIREYGIEKLTQNTERQTTLLSRHANFFRDFASQANPALLGAEAKVWLDNLDTEIDNLRESLSWYRKNDNNQALLSLCADLWRFWQIRGHLSEGRVLLEQALLYTEEVQPDVHGMALLGAGNLAREQGDFEQSIKYISEGQLIFQKNSNRTGMALAHQKFGWTYYRMDDLQKANKSFVDCTKSAEKLADQSSISLAELGRGLIEWRYGNTDAAETLFRKSADKFHEIKNVRREGQALCNLGIISRQRGEFGSAKDLYLRAIELLKAVDDRTTLKTLYNNMGDICLILNDLDLSVDYYQNLLSLSSQLGDKRLSSLALSGLAEAYLAKKKPDDASVYAEKAGKLAKDFAGGLEQGVSLRLLGEVALEKGNQATAQSYFERCIPLLKKAQLSEELEKALLGKSKANDARE